MFIRELVDSVRMAQMYICNTNLGLGGWWDYEGGLTPAACPLGKGGHLPCMYFTAAVQLTGGGRELRSSIIPSPTSHSCYS